MAFCGSAFMLGGPLTECYFVGRPFDISIVEFWYGIYLICSTFILAYFCDVGFVVRLVHAVYRDLPSVIVFWVFRSAALFFCFRRYRESGESIIREFILPTTTNIPGVGGIGKFVGYAVFWGGYGILAIAVLVIMWATIFGELKPEPARKAWQRGRELLSFGWAQQEAKRLVGDSPTVFWGGLNLPESISTTHFCVVGSTGSGKTMTLRLLMQSVLPQVGKGRGVRAVVYDAKQDVVSLIKGINPTANVILLNPFDKRSWAWDIAKDVNSPSTALQVATILIPEEKTSQPFFNDAARHLLTGVIKAFILIAPGKWTLRDVVLSMKTKKRLMKVLLATGETKDLVERYLETEKTSDDILSTIATKMQKYEFIAAAWDRASNKVSLEDWVRGESILVLGNDEAARTALDAINQVLFKRLSELVLAQEESSTRRTWFFLDEIREAGKLEGVSRLLTKGRSKGACVVLGFQDIEGMREVYGVREANEIVGLCANKVFLRTDSPETAQWMSSIFGQVETIEVRQSKSYSTSLDPGRHYGTSGSSTTEHLVKKDLVMASELMSIQPTTARNGMSGYCPGAWDLQDAA
jgi:type IV secretory pathway TraG/TraD family ATPase VirD4